MNGLWDLSSLPVGASKLLVEAGKFTRSHLTINVPVVYMGQYEVVLRGDYP
jgi:hypothetical protein